MYSFYKWILILHYPRSVDDWEKISEFAIEITESKLLKVLIIWYF